MAHMCAQMLLRLARVQPGDFKMIDEVFTLLDPNSSGVIEPPWTDPDLSGWLQKKKRSDRETRNAAPLFPPLTLSSCAC